MLKPAKDKASPPPADVRLPQVPGVIHVSSILFIQGAFECVPNAEISTPGSAGVLWSSGLGPSE